MQDADSDEELGFLPTLAGVLLGDESDDDGAQAITAVDPQLEKMQVDFLLRTKGVVYSKYNKLAEDTCVKILEGDYVAVLASIPDRFAVEDLLGCCGQESPIEAIIKLVCEYLECGAVEETPVRVLQCLWLGFAYLELFCQANYTGPELTRTQLACVSGRTDEESERLVKDSMRALECDGNYCFPICQIPQCLLISRSILSFLANPAKASWSQGVRLDTEGTVLFYNSSVTLRRDVLLRLESISSRHWLNARAAVIHSRCVMPMPLL
jgi:hypothetical protein